MQLIDKRLKYHVITFVTMARSMKCIVCIGSLFLVISYASSNILSYTKDDFLSTVSEKSNFVMFCIPTSKPCKRLQTVWGELAEIYDTEYSFVTLAEVDCAVEKELCADQNVTKYPTLRLFFKAFNDSRDFKDKRDFETLHRFIEEQVHHGENIIVSDLPGAVVQLRQDRFKEFTSEELHFVKFYARWCGHCRVLAPIWHQLALELAGGTHLFIEQVDCTQEVDLCEEYDIKSYPTLLLFYNGTVVDRYKGGRNFGELKAYVEHKIRHYYNDTHLEMENGVAKLTEGNFMDSIENRMVFVSFHTSECERCDEVNSLWRDLAETYKAEDILMAQLDCDQFQHFCQDHQITEFPVLNLYQEGIHLHTYDGELTAAELQAYINSLIFHHEEL